jgi:hypothetical protein
MIRGPGALTNVLMGVAVALLVLGVAAVPSSVYADTYSDCLAFCANLCNGDGTCNSLCMGQCMSGGGPGLARTLGNLSRLAPCLIDSYIGHVDVSLHDARRPDNGED